jgi:hypothetical protein
LAGKEIGALISTVNFLNYDFMPAFTWANGKTARHTSYRSLVMFWVDWILSYCKSIP